jgi:methylamine dehydrogenase heavy chain
LLLAAGAAAALASAHVHAAAFDTPGVATVPAPGPHWFWADDLAFFSVVDGRSMLVDADTGRFVGMLSTGALFAKLDLPGDYGTIYSVETYYSRGTRGERTDVVTYYDPTTLAPTGEVVIPPHRQSGVPLLAMSGLTDDDRPLLVYNFNPAQSITVVDVGARKVAGELPTPGCALVYPAGPRRFAMLCQDGALLTIDLNDAGGEAARTRSAPFFDPKTDPITEKGVRLGKRWLFASFGGRLHEVDAGGAEAAFASWPLLDDADRAESWAVGGAQHLALHAASGRLYALMHQGGADSHKDPGTEVWVYDVAAKRRVQRIALQKPAVSIQVTQDAAPVLLATLGEPVVEVYGATTGAHRRTIEGLGQTPLVLQTIPGRTR